VATDRTEPALRGRPPRYRDGVRLLLVSTYELGHQPWHLATPAAALLAAGHEVRCADLSLDPLDPGDLAWAEAVAFSVPMHTAMRLCRQVVADIRLERPELPIAVYGLYATTGCPGASLAVSGEYLEPLLGWADRQATGAGPSAHSAPVRALGRSPAPTPLPARDLLPPLGRYARFRRGGTEQLVGALEATRGCAHRCRHCPVPTVYDGRTRAADLDVLLADVDQLVGMGATHLSFGDPDFLNRPAHASRVVDAVHRTFPALTFDVTVKVEHILADRARWRTWAASGCAMVTTAVESAEDRVLARLAKGHTAAQAREAVAVLRRAGIEPRVSFVPFTPWTTADGLVALLDLVATADLTGNVDVVQMAIRLLLPPGSLLLDDPTVQACLDGYDDDALGWRWQAPDRRLDDLQLALGALAEEARDWPPEVAHTAVRATVADGLGQPDVASPPPVDPALASPLPPADRPRMTEAWFCCAEPTAAQRATAAGSCR
jgi:radical SAM superfamily enzyme YgiQ (UPF0313 family)